MALTFSMGNRPDGPAIEITRDADPLETIGTMIRRPSLDWEVCFDDGLVLNLAEVSSLHKVFLKLDMDAMWQRIAEMKASQDKLGKPSVEPSGAWGEPLREFLRTQL